MRATLSVALLPQLLPADWARIAPVAVVIDTLRFTSTAAVALAAGARAITVVSDIQRARDAARALGSEARLCGERECVRIPGFDLGNSPSEYTSQAVRDRELVFSTTNGTVAVEAAHAARTILLGSLLNRGAVCRALTADKIFADDPAVRSVWLLCAGTDGQVALEDVLTAGAIAQRLAQASTPGDSGSSEGGIAGAAAHGAKQIDWQLANDAAQLALDAWRSLGGENTNARKEAGNRHALELARRLELARGGRNLIDAGFAADLEAVAKLDSLDHVVPHQTTPGRFENL